MTDHSNSDSVKQYGRDTLESSNWEKRKSSSNKNDDWEVGGFSEHFKGTWTYEEAPKDDSL